MCQGCDLGCVCQTEVQVNVERKQTAETNSIVLDFPVASCSCLSLQCVGLWACLCSIMAGAKNVCVTNVNEKNFCTCVIASISACVTNSSLPNRRLELKS